MLKQCDNYEEGFGKFYAGQRVIAVAAPDGSAFKNGTDYIVSGYEWKMSTNPIAKGKHFWYIGIVGHADGGTHFHPGMFAPLLSNFIAISFSEVREIEKLTTSAN